MPDPVATIAWDECLVPRGTPPADLVRTVRRHHGWVPDWVGRLAPLPWLVEVLTEMASMPIAYLPVRTYTVVALVVSRDNSCRYCYGQQRALMRVLGYGLDVIERLERDQLVETDQARAAALEFARRVSRASTRPTAADRAALARAAGLSPATVAELAFAAASTVFANRVSMLLALPPDRLQRPLYQLVGRLLRPVIARSGGKKRRRPAPLPMPNRGLGAAVVGALGDSPAAGTLRRAIDHALASPVLPRRTKLLMIAVVARALGCALGERDATAALGSEGLAADDVATTLTHLGSPSLDRREAALLPFARATVRCQPPAIQRETRALADALDLSVPELLEVVGVAGLANTLCRASVIVAPG
jgi:alkylhydroperoxidase family enzyme